MPITISSIPILRTAANTTLDLAAKTLLQDGITELMILRAVVTEGHRKVLARYNVPPAGDFFPAGGVLRMLADLEHGPDDDGKPVIKAHFLALEGRGGNKARWDKTLKRFISEDTPAIDYALGSYADAINTIIDADAWMRAARPNGAGATRL